MVGRCFGLPTVGDGYMRLPTVDHIYRGLPIMVVHITTAIITSYQQMPETVGRSRPTIHHHLLPTIAVGCLRLLSNTSVREQKPQSSVQCKHPQPPQSRLEVYLRSFPARRPFPPSRGDISQRYFEDSPQR